MKTDDVAPLRPDAALFLDFDGTLAPLGDDPDAVRLPPEGAAVLRALHDLLDGALVIISGRDIRDLAARTPLGLWRVGGHGLDVCAPGTPPEPRASASAPADLKSGLARLADRFPGARLEDKGAVLALHYRAAPNAGRDLANSAARLIGKYDGYGLQHGKMVLEAKPKAANKGAALAAMMARPDFAGRTPVMVGDDVTDEDAMIAALKAGGAAIKVGAGETAAPWRLAHPGAVWTWLKRSVSL